MDDASTIPHPPLPAHVPPHLVRLWNFDAAPGAHADPYAANRPLHDGPEIFFSPLMATYRDPGAWVLTRTDHMREMFQDTETFSSRHIAGFSLLLGEDWPLLPLEKDPPDHGKYRMLLNPLFAPAKIAALEAGIRETAADLVGRALPNGGCDFEKAFGRPFPVTIFLRLMGLPLEHADRFVQWETGLLHGKSVDESRAAALAIKTYLMDVIAERRRAPIDDLVSVAVTSRIDGQLLSDEEILGVCYLLFVAGLDTIAATLGFTFKHLATHPQDQQLLRDEPDLIPNAVEELIRSHAVVTSPRYVTRDVDFHGAPMKAGDRVLLPMQLSGRDPREHEGPDRIDFRRQDIRHISFAAGPHRCVGSHLARREIRIALEEWLKRVPEFRIAPGEAAVTHATSVWGVDYLPLSWA